MSFLQSLDDSIVLAANGNEFLLGNLLISLSVEVPEHLGRLFQGLLRIFVLENVNRGENLNDFCQGEETNTISKVFLRQRRFELQK